MKITLDIPDETGCMNIALVYQQKDWTMAMAAKMIGTSELKDGAVFHIPAEREKVPAQVDADEE